MASKTMRYLASVNRLTERIQAHWMRHYKLQAEWSTLMEKMTREQRRAIADELGWVAVNEQSFYDMGA